MRGTLVVENQRVFRRFCKDKGLGTKVPPTKAGGIGAKAPPTNAMASQLRQALHPDSPARSDPRSAVAQAARSAAPCPACGRAARPALCCR